MANIAIRIDANTQEAQRNIAALNASVSNIATASRTAAEGTGAYSHALDLASTSSRSLGGHLDNAANYSQRLAANDTGINTYARSVQQAANQSQYYTDATNSAAQSAQRLATSNRASNDSFRDLRQAIEIINQASINYAQQADNAARASERLANQSNQVTPSLFNVRNALIAVAVAATAIGLVKVTTHFIELNNELMRASEQLGVNAQELQVWQMAADKVGLSGEKMRDILQDVSDKIGDFSITGGGEAEDIIEKLNLDIKELVNQNPVEILTAVNEALQNTTEISRAEEIFLLESLANDGSKLLPILKDNLAALEEVQRVAEQRKSIITAEDSDLLSRANVELKELKSSVSAVGKQVSLAGSEIAVAFAPEITEWIDGHRDAIDGFIGSIGNLASEIDSGQFGDSLADDFSSWIDLFDSISSGANDVVSNVSTVFSLLNSIVADSANQGERDYSLSVQGIINAFLDLPVNVELAFIIVGEFAHRTVNKIDTWFSVMGIRLNNGFVHIKHAWNVAMNGLRLAAAHAIDFILSGFAKLENARASLLNAIGATETAAAAIAKAKQYESAINNVANAKAKAEEEEVNYNAALSANNAEIQKHESILEKANNQSRLRVENAKADRKASIDAKLAKAELNNEYYSAVKAQGALDQAQRISEKSANLAKKGHSDAAGAMEEAAKKAKKLTGASKATKKATNKLTTAQKAAKKATSDLAKEHERIQKAYENEKNSIEAHHIELTKGKAAAYEFKKEKQGLTGSMITELLAMKNVNKALEETNKLKKEAQKYYKDQLKSLDDQFAKLNLSKRAYKELKVSQENLNPSLQAEILARYDAVTALEKQIEVDKKRTEQAKKIAEEITSIGDDLAGGIADKLLGGTQSWSDILKNWWGDIKSFFAKNILQPLIQPFTGAITGSVTGMISGAGGYGGAGMQTQGGGIGGLSSMGGLLGKGGSIFGESGLLFGHSIGEGIVTFADKFGATAGKMFSKGVGTSNLAFGAAGALGGFFGDKMFGGNGGIGGGLGAMAGMAAIGGPIGALAGGLLGGLLGGLGGHKKNNDARGVGLGFENGQVTTQNWQDYSINKGWVGGTKRGTDWTETNEEQQELQKRLQAQFDSSVEAIKQATEYFGYEGADAAIFGFKNGIEKIDPTSIEGFAESVISTQLSDVESGLITGLSQFKEADIGLDQLKTGVNSVVDKFGSSISQAATDALAKIQLTENGQDISEEEATSRIQDWLSDTISGIFEGVIGTDFDQHTLQGENLAETLGRVFQEVQSVTAMAETLGLQFGLTGKDAIQAAGSLVATAGGLDALGGISASYFNLLYSEAEQKQMLIDQAHAQLDVLNLQNNTNITTVEGLKSLIQSLDLTTQAGQDSFVSLNAFIPALDLLGDAALIAAQKASNAASQLSLLMSGVQSQYNALTMDKRSFAKQKLDFDYQQQIDAATELGASTQDLAKITEVYDLQLASLLVSTKSVGQEVEGVPAKIHTLTSSLGIVKDAFNDTSRSIQDSIDKIDLGDDEFQNQQWSGSGLTDDMIDQLSDLRSTFTTLKASTAAANEAIKATTNTTKEQTQAEKDRIAALKKEQDLLNKLQESYEQTKRGIEDSIFALQNSEKAVRRRAWQEQNYTSAMISTLETLSQTLSTLEKAQQITDGFNSEIKGLQDYYFELSNTTDGVKNRIWTEKEYSKAMKESLQEISLQISALEKEKAITATYEQYKQQLEATNRTLTLSTEQQRDYKYSIDDLTDSMIDDLESLQAANDSLVETQRIGTAFDAYKEQIKQQRIELIHGKQALQDYKWQVEGLSDTMIIELHSLQAANDAYTNTVSLFETQLQAVGDNYQRNKDILTESFSEQIEVFETLKETAKDIRGYLMELKFSDLSSLIPIDKLTAARKEFEQLKADSNNPESAALITKAGQTVLELSRQIYGSSDTYQQDESFVKTGLESVAAQIENLHDPQIDLLRKQEALLAQAKTEYLRITDLYQSNLDQEVWLSIINSSLGSLPNELAGVLTPLFGALSASIANIQVQVAERAQVTSQAASAGVASDVNKLLSAGYTSNQILQSDISSFTSSQGKTILVTAQNTNGDGINTQGGRKTGGIKGEKTSYKTGNSEGIPYDDFPANLHKDEIVVDAQSRFAIQRYFKATVARSPSRSTESNELNQALMAQIERLTGEVISLKKEVVSLHMTQQQYAKISLNQGGEIIKNQASQKRKNRLNIRVNKQGKAA